MSHLIATSKCSVCGADIYIDCRADQWRFQMLNGAPQAQCKKCAGKGAWRKVK